MADTTTTTIAVILVFVMIAVTWLELRVLRKKSRARRDRTERAPQELQDEAHNALITTRAIASTLAERSGVHSEDVDTMLREAQMAYNRRNYRVALDLTQRTRERLVTLKGAQSAHGDAARLDSLSSGSASDEPTTKEVLQKQFPPNLIQSKFAITVAEASVEEAAASGRDVSAAQSLLAAARSRFDAQDYGAALSVARQADKSAKGQPVTTSAPPAAVETADVAATSPPPPRTVAVPLGTACPSCGTPLKPEDAFCRKCGTRVVLTNCPSCGASLLPDDAFCRKCGTRLQR